MITYFVFNINLIKDFVLPKDICPPPPLNFESGYGPEYSTVNTVQYRAVLLK